ncbi:MAG: DUF1570 domain-containing protein [Planctomycetota bacterium]|nr:MAG: DUF1570 domain-containing protein [Planctomycetota bacterium]
MASVPAVAGPQKLLEFQLADESYRGKVAALGRDFCWVMERDGRLNRLPLRKIKTFRTVSNRFRPYRAAEMREQLRREFGKAYEVTGTTHYLVCAPAGQGEGYADLFEAVYREFRRYFSARGFRLDKPQFLLVAVVFPDRATFLKYMRRDGVTGGAGMVGYYSPTSNRIALYDSRKHRLSQSGRPAAGTPVNDSWPPLQNVSLFAAFEPRGSSTGQHAYGRIEGDLEATIIHEATHQAAFNIGLHSRIGENPRWVVEGLATVFESSAIPRGGGFVGTTRGVPINPDQLIAFQSYLERRQRGSLESFIANDDLYRRSVYAFYGQAWAFSLYLIETRSSRYARFLKRSADRDPLKPYPPQERLADFKETIGSDLDRLETDFLRYMRSLTTDVNRR